LPDQIPSPLSTPVLTVKGRRPSEDLTGCGRRARGGKQLGRVGFRRDFGRISWPDGDSERVFLPHDRKVAPSRISPATGGDRHASHPARIAPLPSAVCFGNNRAPRNGAARTLTQQQVETDPVHSGRPTGTAQRAGRRGAAAHGRHLLRRRSAIRPLWRRPLSVMASVGSTVTSARLSAPPQGDRRSRSGSASRFTHDCDGVVDLRLITRSSCVTTPLCDRRNPPLWRRCLGDAITMLLETVPFYLLFGGAAGRRRRQGASARDARADSSALDPVAGTP